MDKVHKIVNIDNSRSHRTGLLPFVHYNTSANTICNVNGSDTNGNHGHYVCDFVILDKVTRKEISRLRYLDVLNKYRFIQEQLNNAAYVQKKQTASHVTKDVYVVEDNCGKINTQTIETNDPTIKLSDNSQHLKSIKTVLSKLELEVDDDTEDKIRYEYIPLNSIFFTIEDGNYTLKTPITHTGDDESITKYNEELEQTRKTILDGDNFVIIPEYSTVEQYNKDWERWWREHFIENEDEPWETRVFTNYTFSEKINPLFKFCDDFDRYVLGIVEVTNKYVGEKVPGYVYYTNINDYMGWFRANSAATVNAYESKNDGVKWRCYKWEEMGGGDFYNFLSNIDIKWQDNHESEYENVIFTYAPPVMDFYLSITSSFEDEGLLSPYEYSYVSGVVESVVQSHENPSYEDIKYIQYAYSEENNEVVYANSYYKIDTIKTGHDEKNDTYFDIINKDSVKVLGLTPFFMSGLSISCESKLPSLRSPSSTHISDNFYGLYETYNEENKPQLFKCVFCTASTIDMPQIEIFQSGRTIEYANEEKKEHEITNIIYYHQTLIEKIDKKVITPKNEHDGLFQICCTKTSDIITPELLENDVVYVLEEGDTFIKEMWTWSAKTIHNYEWWECEAIDDADEKGKPLDCCDGENVLSNVKKYKNATILSDISSFVPTPKPEDVYYIKVRYKNGLINPQDIFTSEEIASIKLPYKINEHLNIIEHANGVRTYDCVTSLEESDDAIIIKYVLGATEGEDINTSGIHYEETLSYSKNVKDIIPIDGVNFTELYYNEITENESLLLTNNKDYKKSRFYNRAIITGMEVGSIWTNENAINTMAFSNELYDSLYEEPKMSVSLLYDRGNASAWENHFKLSECNTMEDLIKYGNNFFNL